MSSQTSPVCTVGARLLFRSKYDNYETTELSCPVSVKWYPHEKYHGAVHEHIHRIYEKSILDTVRPIRIGLDSDLNIDPTTLRTPDGDRISPKEVLKIVTHMIEDNDYTMIKYDNIKLDYESLAVVVKSLEIAALRNAILYRLLNIRVELLDSYMSYIAISNDYRYESIVRLLLKHTGELKGVDNTYVDDDSTIEKCLYWGSLKSALSRKQVKSIVMGPIVDFIGDMKLNGTTIKSIYEPLPSIKAINILRGEQDIISTSIHD